MLWISLICWKTILWTWLSLELCFVHCLGTTMYIFMRRKQSRTSRVIKFILLMKLIVALNSYITLLEKKQIKVLIHYWITFWIQLNVGMSCITHISQHKQHYLVRDVYISTAKVLGQLYIVVGFLNTIEVLVVFVCTIYITRKLTCLRDNLPWTDNPEVKERNRASATTEVIICVIFILSEILDIVQIIQCYQAGIDLSEPYHTRLEKMKRFQFLSVMIGSSLNFIVYLVMSENLREAICTPFRNVVRCIKCL